MRRALPLFFLCLLLAPADGQSQTADEPTTELRFATLAPDGTPWMRGLRRWDREIRERTQGRVGLRLYGGGSQGQEPVVIDKMVAGQLDGAALTTTGLSQIVRPVLAIGLASIAHDYEGLDRARRRLGGRFSRMFERQGYTFVAWGDVGRARLFSRRRIAHPRDLRAARVWTPRTDEVFSTFLDVVGARPRRLGIPEVYSALQTGMVDTVPASALAVVALQWHTRLRFYSETSTGVLVGATVFRSERLASLSDEDRTVLLRSGRQLGRRTARLVRRADDQALRVVARRLTAVPPTNEEAWLAAGEETLSRLTGRVFPRALVEAVMRAAETE